LNSDYLDTIIINIPLNFKLFIHFHYIFVLCLHDTDDTDTSSAYSRHYGLTFSVTCPHRKSTAVTSDSVQTVTGQLADKPTRNQSSRRLVNSRTSKLAKTFDL